MVTCLNRARFLLQRKGIDAIQPACLLRGGTSNEWWEELNRPDGTPQGNEGQLVAGGNRVGGVSKRCENLVTILPFPLGAISKISNCHRGQKQLI
jgi:hypothetical protein